MRRIFLFSIAFIMVLGGCAGTKSPPNPFEIAKEEFYAKVKTIAVAPVQAPTGLEEPEVVEQYFQGLIEAKLSVQGFKVIPSQEYSALWERFKEQIGGYFDLETGNADDKKVNEVYRLTCQVLKEKFGVDVTLHPSIQVVEARWNGMYAQWDGVSEAVMSFGASFILGGTSGHMGALSLKIFVNDTDGNHLYYKRGGIQLLSKVMAVGKFVSVPTNELFVDAKRNAKAVDVALDPLSEGVSSTISKGEEEPGTSF
ncbi:MAG: hypothetical protein HY538_08365 [Deltaproteobacteria bacterium]|nr:hypothetical protein [Deltaproteobacteria bacterium]